MIVRAIVLLFRVCMERHYGFEKSLQKETKYAAEVAAD